MNELNLFEVATLKHFRFPYKGVISVEDLWDLTVDELDLVFKTLNGRKKVVTEESLLSSKVKENRELEQMIEIVTYVVRYKQDQATKRADRANKKERKQEILDAIEEAKRDSLKGKSPEELIKMIEELEA